MKHIIVIDKNNWFDEYYAEFSSWGDVCVLAHDDNDYSERDDPDVHYHVWAQESWFKLSEHVPAKRACRVSLRYIEQVPLQDISDMSAMQQAWFQQFLSRADRYDLICVASKASARRLRELLPGLTERIAQIPLGYSPFLGVPDFDREQDLDVFAYGSVTSRRKEVVDRLMPELRGLKVHGGANIWGQERTDYIHRAKILLHLQTIPHLFPSIRTWRALAHGAFWLTEEVSDPHPFTAQEDFAEIPTVTAQNAGAVGEMIHSWLKRDAERNTIRMSGYQKALRMPVRAFFDELCRRVEGTAKAT